MIVVNVSAAPNPQLFAAVYAGTDFPIDPLKPLASYPWIRWAPAYSQSPVEQWTENACAGAPTVTRVTTYKTLTSLIQKGAGIGCLSPWFAEDDPKLTRITPIIEEATMDIWVLIHPDLRGVRRIDALKDLLIGIFANRGKVPIAANKKITHNYLTNMVGPAGLNRAA